MLSMLVTTICLVAAAARQPSSSSSFPTSQAPTRFVHPLPRSQQPQAKDLTILCDPTGSSPRR